jgi:hypothetical protein
MNLRKNRQLCKCIFIVLLFAVNVPGARGQAIIAAGQPAQLDIRAASQNSIRVTLKPVAYKEDFPFTPGVAERQYGAPVISIRSIDKIIKKKVGALQVELRPNPLTIVITNAKGQLIQEISFTRDGRMSFKLDDAPVLGMGEGGPKPTRGVNWREAEVQFDRRGKLDSMQPRWQADAYGSRNPAAVLAGTKGWALYVATPWVLVDMEKKDTGYFIPWQGTTQAAEPE